MGVINEELAAKATVKTNGLGSKPSWFETAIAIGTIIIAVATFDEISVKIIVIKYIVANNT